uniref:Uncharacterized protein n=1 Tax=Physcomitrium patens TaxID=3218 RepID=A0A2K1J9H4_PHYPA|nr:hypothetical protein PHYPA_021289 [Physcomitrium patens]
MRCGKSFSQISQQVLQKEGMYRLSEVHALEKKSAAVDEVVNFRETFEATGVVA